MFSDQILITINAVCIFFLLAMTLIMIVSTRMKGGVGYAALVIVATTVPIYVSNLIRDFGTDISYFVAASNLAVFINLICLPSLYFFIRSQLDKSFRFKPLDLFHIVPAVISFAYSIVYYMLLLDEQVEVERIYLASGNANMPVVVNNVLVAIQFFVYFPWMFRFIHRRKRYLRDNYSDSDYLKTRWIPGFLLLLCILFFLVMLAFFIWPQTDVWLIPIANIIAMGYLVYNVISRSTTAYINRLPDTTEVRALTDTSHQPVMETRQMKEISERIIAYLRDSRVYRNQDLTLAALSLETGIHHRNISIAINGYLHKNFFDLVNEMRVEEAKQLLRELNTSDYTTESIFTECGFRSRSTFFTTFRKFEGTSPAQWLKSIRG